MFSKIYKIESLICNDVYYGCTTKKYLSERMTYYRHEYKKYLNSKENNEEFKHYIDSKIEYGHESLLILFQLFDKYNIKNFKINLVDTIDSNNKEQLKSSYFDYIKNNQNINMINK